MIKILHIVPNMQSGGLETFIMNVMRNIDSSIKFDFLVHYNKRKFYDDEIEQRGSTIYRIPFRENHNIFKYISELNKFFKEHKEYQIIHCHMPSVAFIVFLIAKKNNVKVRILHSHNIGTEKTLKGFIVHILSRFSKYLSTINFACSNEAGKYLFGKQKFTVINNAIDIDKFKYNEKKRTKIRKELNIDDNTTLIGHIGRFCKQKNHDKLIDIFYEYQKINTNSKLILVGEGETYNTIKNKVSNLNLNDKVIFLGTRKDTDYLYSAFDIFILPSISEGLGIVLIEAQISNLLCYTTKDKVPSEAKISNRLIYVEEKLSPKQFAEKINKNYNRKEIKFNKNKDNYDIKKTSKYLENLYKSYYK